MSDNTTLFAKPKTWNEKQSILWFFGLILRFENNAKCPKFQPLRTKAVNGTGKARL